MGELYDWIIIGSGPGASVTARELCRVRAGKVLLLEAAKSDQAPLPFSAEEMRTRMRASGLNIIPGLPPVVIAEPLVLGGGPEINAGIYHAPPVKLLRDWSKTFGLKRIEEIEASAREIEADLGLSQPELSPFEERLREVSTELGHRWLAPRVWWTPEKRATMRETFLKDALQNGLRLETGTPVRSLRFTGKEWRVHAGPSEFRGTRVVIGAGPLESLRILRPFVETRIFRVSLHLQIRMMGVSPLESRRIVEASQWQTPAGNLMGLGVSSPNYLLAMAANDAEKMRTILRERELVKSFYVTPVFNPTLNALPFLPLRYIHYDRRVREAMDISRQELRQFITAATGEDPVVSAPNMTAVHLMGGTGSGEKHSLCDSFGRILNARNLFVTGAPVLNGGTGVNPQGTIMAMALRNVREWIRKG